MGLGDTFFGRREGVKAENAHIPVSTAEPSGAYEILDCVCAVSSQKAGASGVDLDDIFEHVKNKLRAKCSTLGGNAVVACSFDQRGAHTGGLVAAQVIEIWAYGTVIRRINL